MISREDINVLSTSMTLHEGFIAAHLHRHNPLPASRKTASWTGSRGMRTSKTSWARSISIRPIPRCAASCGRCCSPPRTARLPDLMKKLTKGYQHIAVIQDPGGRTVGLVTLEDIIETLVGDLQDEYDAPPDFIVRLSETRFRVGGGASFRQIKSRRVPRVPDATRRPASTSGSRICRRERPRRKTTLKPSPGSPCACGGWCGGIFMILSWRRLYK